MSDERSLRLITFARGVCGLTDVRREFGKQQCVVGGIDDAAKRSCAFVAGEAVAFETAAIDQRVDASAEHELCAALWARNDLRPRRRAGLAGKISRCRSR